MQAVRWRGACTARRVLSSVNTLRPAARSYASDHGHDDHHHDHHHAHQVNESPGLALYLGLGAIGASILLYNISQPSEDGEPPRLRRWIEKFQEDAAPKWEERNTLRTEAFEQAAKDSNLFKSVQKRDFTYRTPELLNSGCPNNVPAGHIVNLDHITEHYRKLHLDQEEQKAKRLAKAKKE